MQDQASAEIYWDIFWNELNEVNWLCGYQLSESFVLDLEVGSVFPNHSEFRVVSQVKAGLLISVSDG